MSTVEAVQGLYKDSDASDERCYDVIISVTFLSSGTNNICLEPKTA